MQFPFPEVQLPDCQENWESVKSFLTKGAPAVKVRGQINTQVVASGTTPGITLASLFAGRRDMWDGSNSLVAPINGLYFVQGWMEWPANGAGIRALSIWGPLGNMGWNRVPPGPPPDTANVSMNNLIALNEGQTLNFVCYQSSAVNLTIVDSFLSMHWVAGL